MNQRIATSIWKGSQMHVDITRHNGKVTTMKEYHPTSASQRRIERTVNKMLNRTDRDRPHFVVTIMNGVMWLEIEE